MNNNSVNGLSQLKKPKRYTVVAFDVENTVVTIPTKWMVNSKNCSFPPYSKTRMDTAIQNCEDSEDSWTIYPCRILRTYDSLQLAIQATENLEQNYSPETEDGINISKMSTRLRFTTSDDLCLLRHVVSINPFLHKYRWEEVLDNFNNEIHKNFSFRSIKEHLELLLKQFNTQDQKNLKKSSTVEEYIEKMQLLTEISEFEKKNPLHLAVKGRKKAMKEAFVPKASFLNMLVENNTNSASCSSDAQILQADDHSDDGSLKEMVVKVNVPSLIETNENSQHNYSFGTEDAYASPLFGGTPGMSTRLRFTTSDDICLLKHVVAINPFQSEYRWEEVVHNFKHEARRNFTLRTVREHMDLLLKQFNKQDIKNLKKSSTEEEYSEKMRLLTEVSRIEKEAPVKTYDPPKKTYGMKQKEMVQAIVARLLENKNVASGSSDAQILPADDNSGNGDQEDLVITGTPTENIPSLFRETENSEHNYSLGTEDAHAYPSFGSGPDLVSSRLRFSGFEDVCLLRHVISSHSFENEFWFEEMCENFKSEVHKEFSNRSIKDHLNLLLKQFYKQDLQKLKKFTASEEEFSEKMRLLTEVSSLEKKAWLRPRKSNFKMSLVDRGVQTDVNSADEVRKNLVTIGNQTPDFESHLPQASIHFSQLPATFRDSILQEPSPKRRKQNDEIAKDLQNSLQPSDVLLLNVESSSLSSVEGPSTPADVQNEDDVYPETKFILESTDPSINTDSTDQSANVLTGHIPNDNSYKALSMKLDKLLAQNAKILDEISSIKSVLASTMQLNCRFDAIDPTKTELPCQTPADLINFNAELKEEDVFACNLQKFRTRGGTSEGDIVRKGLCLLMTNKLAHQYNWVAIRGLKEPFSVLKNITELLYTMTKYHVEDTTQDRVDSHIKKWLSRACDRDGGREARRKTTD